ncbi:MAG: lipoprotein, partial [Muribaculaceae bacterium]|nr:lipoprotein [Muribaculaceae bacterium]
MMQKYISIICILLFLTACRGGVTDNKDATTSDSI